MRHTALLALLAAVAAAPTVAVAATPATTQILQQRTADGRLLLTDRAAPGAKTERSWQVRAEDPVAARQRALEVRAEAHAVSERVQRSIDQQRRSDEEERLRMARFDLERERAELDRDRAYGGGVLLYPGYGLHGRGHRDHHVDHGGKPGNRIDRGGHREHGGSRSQRGLKPLPLRGSAAPGSR
jgi:hypothetical protein